MAKSARAKLGSAAHKREDVTLSEDGCELASVGPLSTPIEHHRWEQREVKESRAKQLRRTCIDFGASFPVAQGSFRTSQLACFHVI